MSIRVLADRSNRRLLLSAALILGAFTALTQGAVYLLYGRASLALLLLCLAASGAVLALLFGYLRAGDIKLERAVRQTERFLSGEREARIPCDEEGELYRLFHAVNTLASALNAQTERERGTNETLKNTISDISHQLKTPLAALGIYTELTESAESMDEVRRFAAASEKELSRMETLIKNLLRLVRMDAGAAVPEKHREELSELMEEVRERFACRAEREGKRLLLEGGEEVLVCDRVWLTEAFGNIVKNALDHTAEGGVIRISWRRSGNLLAAEIADNGSGIHGEDIPYIFKRFYRSRFSGDTQGVGLGLPLARAIIDSHGGTIEVESAPGRGAVFRIYLPADPDKTVRRG